LNEYGRRASGNGKGQRQQGTIGLRALVLSTGATTAHLGRVLLARLGAPREVDAGSRPVPPPRLLVVGQRGGHLVGVRVGLRSSRRLGWGEDEGDAVAEGRCGEGEREDEGEDEGGQ